MRVLLVVYQPKILLLDIENTPELGYSFGTREVDILEVKEHSYILCIAYQWYGIDKSVRVLALPDYKGYKNGADCEEKLVRDAWKLLDSADIVVAQNGDSFDIKKLNSRFAFYRINPPQPYRTIDTLKGLRSRFGLPSNKLDEACKYFGLGGKLPHTGKHLWFGCMSGDRKAWKLMKQYNKRDVDLLRELYELLRPWMKHPNLTVLTGEYACPRCGSARFQKRGMSFTDGGAFVYQRVSCSNCGGSYATNREPSGFKLPSRPL